jgi:serine/threonine-protein kinase
MESGAMGTVHSDARSWDELWEEIAPGPSGGQATSKLGRRRDGTVERGFLKILTKQDQTERRQRFYREAAVLESLNIEGVPQLIETNAWHYENRAFNLYAVSTFVPGKTLRELPAGSYNPEQAIRWTVALCEILRACREAGIRHRDVKPENCILGDDGRLYLVDFGLSSNLNESEGFDTPVGQEIGNRFLRIPEFRPGSVNRDDPRTDLTFAVCVVFFLLTRANPRMLLDEQGRLPHQRGDAAALLQNMPIPQPERLTRIFDQGFQHDLDRRFQSAETLIEALLACLEREGPVAKADALQRKILEQARSPTVTQGQAMIEKLYKIRAQIDSLCDRMLGELGGVLGRLGGPVPHTDMRQGFLSFETGFLYSRDTRAQIMLGFLMRHLGTEIVISVYSNQTLQAEIRVPASTAELMPDDLERIREVYLSKLAVVPGAV